MIPEDSHSDAGIGADSRGRHRPVMVREVLQFLVTDRRGTYLDGTVGEGGHSGELLRGLGNGARLVALDLDSDALAISKRELSEFPQRKHFVRAGFESMREILDGLGIEAVDGILLDLGLGDLQLRGERGFSFDRESPLDMRFDCTQGLTARDVLDSYPYDELKRVFRDYGQFRYPGRLARKIERYRERRPIGTTADFRLALTSGRHGKPAVLARAFMAVRIEVNDELGRLQRALEAAAGCLKPGGRLCVLSYHSLEDRAVKREFLKSAWKSLTRKPVKAWPAEVAVNPRARSAKLRAGEKT